MSKDLKKIGKKIRSLDLCMLTTVSTNGMTASRPMSHDEDAEYDGNSYFFSLRDSHLVKDLKKNKHVNLVFNGRNKLLISVSGKAKLIKDRQLMKEHWAKNLKEWFKDGLDTPGIVMIKVEAQKIKYWKKNKEEEIQVA